MRFAYIDSQGNEVSIPSVDALALRIELGAIGPETELYDAQADRWGPADSHEIYHALARDLAGASFLVPTPPEPEEVEPAAPAAPVESAESRPDSAPSAAPSIEDLGLTLIPAQEEEPDTGPDVEFSGWTELAPAAEDADHEFAPSDEDGFAFPPEPADGPGDFGSASFDFGMPPGPGTATPGAFDAPDGRAGDHESPFSGGFGLEQPLEFGSQAYSGAGAADELDLEPPMSDFDPSAPPAWMEQDGPKRDPLGPTDDTSLMDFGAAAGASGGGAGTGGGAGAQDAWGAGATGPAAPPRSAARTESPSRPAPSRGTPRRTPPRRSGGLGPLVGILGLVAVAAGGWYGWSLLGGEEEAAPVRPPVVIPAIPAELEEPMRSFAAEAIAQMVLDVEAAAFAPEAPTAPSDDWLAGIYLGNASRYEDVEQFWQGIGAFADRLRSDDTRAFHEAYDALAGASDFDAEAAALMTERADSGFMATREARLESYALLRGLADAALALHDYLVVHEPDIAYTPARGFGGNPVEEAVPATDEIGQGMWDRVGAITTALDRLGTLDRVTRERLSTVIRQRIQDIGIR